MSKIGLVFQREYTTRVYKRSFLLVTILIPLIIIGFYAAIIAVSISKNTTRQNLVVVDHADLFAPKDTVIGQFTFHVVQGGEDTLSRTFDKHGYDGLLIIPAGAISNPDTIRYMRETEGGAGVQSDLNQILQTAIAGKRMAAAHLDVEKVRALTPTVNLTATIGGESRKSVAEVARFVGYTAGFLIYLILLIYGTTVMRGVMEEKTSRIAEIIVSSVKPFDLMLGKILGIGAVGLTQFLIWGILIYTFQAMVPLLFHGAQGAGQGVGAMVMATLHSARDLNLPLIVGCFVFYFLGGYLLYASFFASIGCAVSDDAQEAQQMILPITMLVVFSFVIMIQAIADPNSGLAVFGSIFPLSSPIVMVGRIAYGVPTIPLWQLLLSMLLLILTFLCTTWICGKIYRTGILMYGKKITFKEMLKWATR